MANEDPSSYQLHKGSCSEKMSGVGEKVSKATADFLESNRGRHVVVKLTSGGVEYRGILTCVDEHMNIVMKQTEEYVNGQLRNEHGYAYIRGNNVLYIGTIKNEPYQQQISETSESETDSSTTEKQATVELQPEAAADMTSPGSAFDIAALRERCAKNKKKKPRVPKPEKKKKKFNKREKRPHHDPIC